MLYVSFYRNIDADEKKKEMVKKIKKKKNN
jgi:hypothetical protein